MATSSDAEWIVPTRDARSLPVVEILTGRGFVSGKSGSGKSNTVGVIAEELLDNGYNFLIVDTEGEYYGLQEQYQLLHVGGDEFADVRVGADHAEKLAEIGLERNVPIILDVSGFDDVEESQELIKRTVEELFRREKKVRKPFLLVVEEMQEYLPQQGSAGELGEILERVAKRGRKRGLGMCGVSQRPSSVDKDFITQCDWMAWHRLTWEADVKVVSKIIGSDRKDDLTELDPGEAFLMTDWDDTIERVQFRRKRTHDAGATPGLESYDRPDLKTVGSQLIEELEDPQQRADAETASEPEPEAGSLDDLDLPDDAGSAETEPPGAPIPDEPAGSATAEGTAVEDADAAGDAVAAEDLDGDAAEQVQRLRQRNHVLEREVEELRSLLQSIEPEHEDAADHEHQPAFAGPSGGARDGEAGGDAGSAAAGGAGSAAAGAGSARGAAVKADGATAGAGESRGGPLTTPTPEPEPPSPTHPTPPEPPEDKSGLVGELVEFGEMLIYMLLVVVYRFRVLLYKLRYRT